MRRSANSILVGLFLTLCAAPVALADEMAAASQPVVEAAASQPVASPDQGVEFLKQIMGAVQKKQWMGVTALLLIACVWFTRKMGAKVGWLKWTQSDRGGAVLVMAMSVVGAIATSLGAGKAMTGDTVLAAVYIGFMAAGGWSWAKRMIGSDTIKDPPKA